MIGRNGERGSGISALAARHDDDDDMPIWFSKLNIIFNAKKITPQSSCYAYVDENLLADVAIEDADLLDDMPDEKPYDTLKNIIIRRVRKSGESVVCRERINK